MKKDVNGGGRKYLKRKCSSEHYLHLPFKYFAKPPVTPVRLSSKILNMQTTLVVAVTLPMLMQYGGGGSSMGPLVA